MVSASSTTGTIYLSGQWKVTATGTTTIVYDGLTTDAAAILVDTAEIGAAGAGLTALATAADLSTESTKITAIKAKTDSLTYTVAGQVDANIQYVNDVAVTGDGGTGTEWGPV